METRVLIAKAVLAGCEFTEVASGLWDRLVVELEDNTALRDVADGDVELSI